MSWQSSSCAPQPPSPYNVTGFPILFVHFYLQGKTTVASIDDNEELEYTDDAFNVLGFSEEEKWNCYQMTACVMTFGEVRTLKYLLGL